MIFCFSSVFEGKPMGAVSVFTTGNYHGQPQVLGGLKNLPYNRAGAECNGANTFFSVKDSGVLRFFSK